MHKIGEGGGEKRGGERGGEERGEKRGEGRDSLNFAYSFFNPGGATVDQDNDPPPYF